MYGHDLAMSAAITELQNAPRKTVMRATHKAEPFWNLSRDGITFSLLSKFVICRHRFWIKAVLGYKEEIGFNHKLEYGTLMHAGFEAFAACPKTNAFEKRVKAAQAGIKSYCANLHKEHMGYSADISFWETVASRQFAVYAKHWQKKDANRHYVAQEMVFDQPTKLPSGRTVRIRGKIDELFHAETSVKTATKIKHGVISKGGTKSKLGPLVLQENKCKGRVDELGLIQSLHNDFQTMLYLHVLDLKGTPARDVLYNVITRPLGGEIGNAIQQRKGRGKAKSGSETSQQFCERVCQLSEDNPDQFFRRFPVKLAPGDLDIFRKQTLYPILEQLVDWWESIANNPFDPWTTKKSHSEMENEAPGFNFTTKPNKHHFVRPFGIYDSLSDGMNGDYFRFITSGGLDKSGLIKTTELFPELADPSLMNQKAKKR